ncbi:MAG: DUF695 domain-containing protein [Candidatus Eisenbacteria bacterium]|uniref:DUF695 domain-containing protein n=1 Tax=Eiseniibacteriota bacterium TaxID=2212470 RepID=A0A956LZA5_UNCEI|nr:DUF695 domain-containing protein [Candidatus Eisenbacteria bacterium]
MNADEDKWDLLRGTYEDNPVMIRARQFAGGIDRAAYPIRLNVFWRMTAPDENGLASSADAPILRAFEERLVQAVDHDGQSVLSVVITCNGQREYVLHTADASEFLRRLTEMPQEEDPYPIEIHKTDDPDWDYDQAVTETT